MRGIKTVWNVPAKEFHWSRFQSSKNHFAGQSIWQSFRTQLYGNALLNLRANSIQLFSTRLFSPLFEHRSSAETREMFCNAKEFPFDSKLKQNWLTEWEINRLNRGEGRNGSLWALKLHRHNETSSPAKHIHPATGYFESFYLIGYFSRMIYFTCCCQLPTERFFSPSFLSSNHHRKAFIWTAFYVTSLKSLASFLANALQQFNKRNFSIILVGFLIICSSHCLCFAFLFLFCLFHVTWINIFRLPFQRI